jgi:undecaprenyl-diphosphatase
MSALEALWLGIVQGLTEFLPVSSSGHLVMFETLLGVEGEGGLLFEVAVHVATLAAIVIFYRRRILELVVGAVRGRGDAWRYGAKLALGTLPAVAVGLGGRELIEAQFSSPPATGICLLITGAILWTTRSSLPRARSDEPGWGAAFAIGLAQAVAILPGISRSGATVAAALALGVKPEKAAEFSFLLGIVAIAGAAVLVLPGLGGATPELLASLLGGGIAALVSGLVAIWLFIRLLRSQVFYRFSYYTWGAGALFLAWLALRQLQ